MEPELKRIRDKLTKECVRQDFSKIVKELNIPPMDQRFIIEHFCKGKEYSIIAREAGVCEETVKAHIRKIYIKLTNCLDRIIK